MVESAPEFNSAKDAETFHDDEEDNSRENLKGNVFVKYILFGGSRCGLVLVIFSFVFTQICASVSDYLVKFV